MKSIKTGIVLALLTAAASLFAMGGGESGDAKKTDGGLKTITLKITHNMDFVTIPDAVIEAGNRLNARYEKEGKNIRVAFEKDYQTIDWVEYKKNIIFAHKSGDAPDMFTCDADITSLVEAGVVTDLSALKTDLFAQNAWECSTVNGKQWAMPFDLPLRVIYYSKDCLRKLGWSEAQIAELPKKIAKGQFTFEQFMALAEETVAKGAARYGLMHRPGAGLDFLDIIATLGGQWHNEKGQFVFDEAAIRRFFEFTYKNANITKITPPNLNQLGWGTINKAVGTGEAFAYYGPIFSSVYVAQAGGKTPEEFAQAEEFVLFPVSQYNKKPFAVAAPQCMAISAQTKYPDLCKDLLQELATNSTDLLAKHAATTFSLSSVKKANADPQVTQHPILSTVTYMENYAVPSVTIPGLMTFRSELFKQIVTLELGQTKPDESLAALKKQMQLNVAAESIVFK